MAKEYRYFSKYKNILTGGNRFELFWSTSYDLADFNAELLRSDVEELQYVTRCQVVVPRYRQREDVTTPLSDILPKKVVDNARS